MTETIRRHPAQSWRYSTIPGDVHHLVDIGNKQTVPFRVFVMNNCDNLLSRVAALRLGLLKRLDNINDLAFGEVGRPVQCDPIKIV